MIIFRRVGHENANFDYKNLLAHVYELLHKTVCHELKSPLNVILLTTRQLSQTQINARQAKLIQMNLISANNVLNLTNDLIDMYLLQNCNSFNPQLRRTKLSLFFQILENLSLLPALEKQIKVDVLMDEKVPEELIFDDKRLRSILTNLIYNAIKFTGKNGQVQIQNEYDETTETWTIIV